MRSWDHTGFGFDQSVHLPAGDRKGIERLVQYMVRCPFSLARLIKVTAHLVEQYETLIEELSKKNPAFEQSLATRLDELLRARKDCGM